VLLRVALDDDDPLARLLLPVERLEPEPEVNLGEFEAIPLRRVADDFSRDIPFRVVNALPIALEAN
jgi:hypothetical protein